MASRTNQERVKAKVKETVREEVERVRDISSEAVRSGAYLYPIKVKTLVTKNACTKLTSSGNCLFPSAPGSLAAAPFEAGAYSHSRGWRDKLHVHFRLSATSRGPVAL